MKKLELFVYIECAQMTPEAMLADYVLPGTSQFERPSGYATISCQAEIEYEISGDRAVPEKIPGLWDLKDDSIIYRDLAVGVLGKERVDKVWTWKTLEEFQDMFYKPAGWTRRQVNEEWKGVTPWEPRFKKYEDIDPEAGEFRGFGTPEGKVAFYSTILEELGYDPLPSYVENAWTPISAPDIAKDYPLIMTSGARFQEAQHGELRHISLMRKLRPVPRVKIHPLTARNMGIGDGEWVYIETPLGRCRQTVRYDFGHNPKVIDPEHSWWRPELPGEEPTLFGWLDWNINQTIPDSPEHLSPELGAWCFKVNLAKIYSANIS
jgi:anaerobic selenocysteine-containing dehydrogenase